MLYQKPELKVVMTHTDVGINLVFLRLLSKCFYFQEASGSRA